MIGPLAADPNQLVGDPVAANYMFVITWWHVAAFVVAVVLVFLAARRGWWGALVVAIAVFVGWPAVRAIGESSVFHTDQGLYYGSDTALLLIRLAIAGSAAACLAIAWFVGRQRRRRTSDGSVDTPAPAELH